MMEETNIPLANGPAPLGEIEIAPEVIEVIAGIAANEVEGVYAMQGSFKTGVNELLGRTTHNKGVHLTVDENGLSVDVYCYIKYGASVPKVRDCGTSRSPDPAATSYVVVPSCHPDEAGTPRRGG